MDLHLNPGQDSASLNPPDIEAAPTDPPMDVTPQTIEEIRMGIRQIKSGKATVSDNIPAEASSEVRHRRNCKYAPRSTKEDLGGRTGIERLERRTPLQDTEEKRSGQV
ncbi:unnamed protein product [Schistosoma mattheei]|uniref:Uncharacterized protein n=1 Tax=Schistosoma mattheei TaxID=31246 RepID=A0A183PEY7_9TREM|nr:unnamed protein product [Schistosoma mattheei]